MERRDSTGTDSGETEDPSGELPRAATEERYRSLFEHMFEGVAHCRMTGEGADPADFVFLEVNPAFGKLTGLAGVEGRRVSDVLPSLRQANPELFDAFGRVARTGVPERFETYVVPLGSWFAVSVYRPAPGQFVSVFDNVTEGKRALEELKRSRLAAMNLMEDALASRDRARGAAASLKGEVTERREAEEALRESEQRFQDVVNASADWVWELDEAGRYTYASKSVEQILGYSAADLLGKTPFDLMPPDEAERVALEFAKVSARKAPFRDFPNANLHKDGSLRHLLTSGMPVLGPDGALRGYRGMDRDFTDQKLAEEQRKHTVELLSICNSAAGSRELMADLVAYFRRVTQCEAVGVRLKEGDDFPYYATRGFPEEFVLLEKTLCSRDARGELLRDAAGDPVLECMCGNVLRGRFDPSKPFFTPHGSFWASETSRLLATTTDADRQAPTRNRCNGEGYESVALVPLRLHGDTYGLFQFNDRRRGCFTPEKVAFFETLVDYVAIALAKLRVEEELRESDEFNRQIVASVGEGVVVYSQDMKFQVWNPFMEALTGVPAEAVRGRHPLELFPFLEEAGVYEQVRRALEGERTAPVVLAHRPPLATSEGWTSNASSALRNTRGEVIGAITTVRDVTREREDEEALRKLSQAIDQSPAAVVITDTDGKIEFVNPKFAQLTGYTLEEARGQNPRILKGDTPPELFEELWSTITAGRIWVGEFHNRKKDGTLYWERATLSPLKDAGGRTTHYLALKEDISDRKLLEAQLQQSQRIEAVGRLAGGIAHDFNNMLTVILNYAELTMYSLDPQDPLYANVQEIRKAAERSADLTRQLLAFSRKQIIEPQAVKLNAFFEGEKKLLGRLIGEDVSVAFVPGEGLWDVFIDPSQMDQILTNLAVNARDAIAGVGGITVSTRNAHVGADEAPRLFLEPGEYVLLTFSDTGCGMDEKTVERIFEPFYTTKELGKGTGLGLSTVYGIVKQNRGAIHVESAPGRGTTFRLYFPRFVERRRKPRVAPQGAVPTGTETVLVVEDERRILEIAKTVLESCGYEVLVAPTPDEALRISGEHPGEIDLLLSDVVMPLMNGKDLEARVAKARPGIKTLFMSGYTADTIAPYGVLDEEVNFIHKPFTVASLAEKVRRVLDAG